eukprot:10323-Heterococcus_DN1.PRE.4
MFERLLAIRWRTLYQDEVVDTMTDDEKVAAGCCLPCLLPVVCVITYIKVLGEVSYECFIFPISKFVAALFRVLTCQAQDKLNRHRELQRACCFSQGVSTNQVAGT